MTFVGNLFGDTDFGNSGHLPLSDKARDELESWGFSGPQRERIISEADAAARKKGQARIDYNVMHATCSKETYGAR